jgi:MFS family permease
VLFVLVVVYTFNFIDRQIIGILAVPIKEELGLTDTQVGLMSGLAFALFYTFLGVPIATLADRKNRVWIMTAALTVWSGFTAACGLAQSYGQLFLARLGVGVGEAGGVAPAYSLISDYFPPQQRARALAVYSFGIPIGSAVGIVLGGILTSLFDWRVAFFVVGLAGILIAPVFRATVREPERGRFGEAVVRGVPEAPPGGVSLFLAFLTRGVGLAVLLGILTLAAAAFVTLSWKAALFALVAALLLTALLWARTGGPAQTKAPATVRGVRVVLDVLVRKPSFWGLSLGAAFSSMMGYGLFLWMPAFLVRSFGDALPGFFAFMPAALLPPEPSTLLYASYFYGAVLLIGGVAGVWLGGVLADRFGQERKSAYALIPAGAFALTVPFLIVGLLTPSLLVAFLVLIVPTALGLVWLGPVITAFQHLVPPHMRATASAVFLFVNNLVGIGVGQAAIGAISDGLAARFAEESLRYAILTGTSFYVVAALLMAVTARRLARDWE